MFNGRNFTDSNDNWKWYVEFYDCEPVLQPDYESPDGDKSEIVKQTQRRRAASAVMLSRLVRRFSEGNVCKIDGEGFTTG